MHLGMEAPWGHRFADFANPKSGMRKWNSAIYVIPEGWFAPPAHHDGNENRPSCPAAPSRQRKPFSCIVFILFGGAGERPTKSGEIGAAAHLGRCFACVATFEHQKSGILNTQDLHARHPANAHGKKKKTKRESSKGRLLEYFLGAPGGCIWTPTTLGGVLTKELVNWRICKG